MVRPPTPAPSHYYRGGLPTANSGRTLVCSACGETRSAVGSRRGKCRCCHRAAWRANKGLAPIPPPPAYKTCLSCRVNKGLPEYVVPTAFECDRVITSSTCRECRSGRRRLPLARGDRAYLLALLGPRCAVCRDPLAGKGSHLDHCRFTGVLRGVLCTRCCHAVGVMRDRADLVAALHAYLTR